MKPDWGWDFGGAVVPSTAPVSPAFTTRFDAEEWLGENWRSLAARGVATARLRRAGEAVGPAIPLVGSGIPDRPDEA